MMKNDRKKNENKKLSLKPLRYYKAAQRKYIFFTY